MTDLSIPAGYRRVYAVPDTEPVETEFLSRSLRADWITDDLVRRLEEEGA